MSPIFQIVVFLCFIVRPNISGPNTDTKKDLVRDALESKKKTLKAKKKKKKKKVESIANM